jgi:hypothetical protein
MCVLLHNTNIYIAHYREVTEKGKAIVNDFVIAMHSWLHHVPGLARPAYPHEIVPNGPAEQVHLGDGCHRLSYVRNM